MSADITSNIRQNWKFGNYRVSGVSSTAVSATSLVCCVCWAEFSGHLIINDRDLLARFFLAAFAAALRRTLRPMTLNKCHLKINTGMEWLMTVSNCCYS